MEITETEKKKKRSEHSLRDLWDIKCTNICIIRVPEGKGERDRERIGRHNIIAENFPDLGKKTDIQVQDTQRVPNSINLKRTTQRHIVIKIAKIKDREY